MIKKITIIVAILLISAVCLGLFVACEAKEWGKFYSLQEAYDQGLLSVEDLEQIAEYQNIWKTDDRKAEGRPKVEDLDKKTVKEIKETTVFNDKLNGFDNAKVSDAKISKYLGTYNDCTVVMIRTGYRQYIFLNFDIEVAGVMFHYNDSATLEVYIKNK